MRKNMYTPGLPAVTLHSLDACFSQREPFNKTWLIVSEGETTNKRNTLNRRLRQLPNSYALIPKAIWENKIR